MSAIAEPYEQADIFRDLRNQAIALSSDSLQPRNGLYALLMETGYEEAAVTVLAAADGTASMYFSNGGGMVGAGDYEEVRDVVFDTLSAAEKYMTHLDETESYPLPGEGRTRFYAVTEEGVLTSEAAEDQYGEDRHELSPLFHQVHELIAIMRVAEEHRRSQEQQ